MNEQDFLIQIREAEQRAETLIAQARDSARQEQESARTRADEILAHARETAALERQNILAAAETQADRMSQQGKSEAAAAAAVLTGDASNLLDDAVRKVAERIVS